jgi:radical SAM protein with 4Fe4S-binding SPASM domain
MPLPDGVEKHFDEDTKGFKDMLDNLWNTLCDEEFYGEQSGPYPASHGKKHVKIVVERLAELINSFEKMGHLEKFEIFAAGMIHDVGMIKMLTEGAYSDIAEKCRDNHANFVLIERIAQKPLDELKYQSGDRLSAEIKRRIKLIAAGHAGDNGKSAKRKQEDVRKESNSNRLIKGMKILRLADYLDIGEDRLATTWKEHDWRDNQLRHLKQHKVLTIDKPTNKLIVVKPTRMHDSFRLGVTNDIGVPSEEIHVSPIEVIAILRSVHEKLRPIFNDYNELADEDKKWQLEPLDERLFGIVWPLVLGVGLFQGVLKRQLERSLAEGPLPIDLMGHSLHGRFVKNEESLNDELIEHLEKGHIKMRILLLDPHIESQQMCEVYDAQREREPEEGRSILPRYNENSQVIDSGDILKSLSTLEKDWKEKVGPGSSFEVRLTSRLMYMNLSRYGNTIIATPYSGRGLFNSSIGLLHEEESVLNNAYKDEFESIWKSLWETRLYMHVDKSNAGKNPVKRLIPSLSVEPQTFHPLDYERYFLQSYTDRVIAVFNFVKYGVKVVPPPIEVEIQPSSECNLRCWHCIGKNLPHRHKDVNENLLPGQADALLTWQSAKFAVERFRISGLIGDPLHEATTLFTLDFLEKSKNKGRRTVLFTNGFGIKEPDFNRLLSADNIHVSLDAATSGTFEQMKGAGKNDFKNITTNLRSLCAELHELKNNEKKIGIGFVVNETNVSEVEAAISLAKNIRASFIRFKPDIRATRAIPWRTWREAKLVISNAQKKDKGGLDVIMTNVAWQHSRLPLSDRCWAQYFFASIAPNGKVHVCDHLTECNGEASIGDLRSGAKINELWTTAVKDKQIGKRTAHCRLCPPFNWHINRLLEQLFVLYDQYGEDKLKGWISKALHND